MKRLVTATALLAALAAGAQAGSLPKPIHLVNAVKPFHFSPYVRAGQASGASGSASMQAEARQQPAQPQAPATASKEKPAPQSARAD